MALLAFLGCAEENPPGSPPPADTAASAGEDRPAGIAPPDSTAVTPAPGGDAWTLGIVDEPGTLTASTALPIVRAVRSAAQDGYDRFTVELSPGGLPGYHVEYVDRPLIQCGSGQETHPVGSAWLELRLYPTNAHTEAGAPTLSGREIPLEGRLFRRMYLTCDFEAVVTLVVAVDSPNPYKVITLADPPRIVLDVRHSRR